MTTSSSRAAHPSQKSTQPHLSPTSRKGLHLAHPSTARPAPNTPLGLWHLLSLDAPTVAALWTAFIAASCHLSLPATTPLAMALAVWMLYAADRLLDTRHLYAQHPNHSQPYPTNPHRPYTLADPVVPGLEARHLFHHRHRRPFLLGILLASAALALLLPHLSPGAIHIDLLLGSLLFGYFILIHTTGNPHRLPKEFAVGIFFSAAVFVPTIARAPQLLLPLLPQALLFGVLCTLNCLFIYAWEHDPSRSPIPTASPHSTTQLALRYLRPLALVAALAGLALALATRHHALPLAIALSSSLLLLLDRARTHLSPLHVRACADLVLLTPLLFLPLLVN